jgi:hypothetical protein
VGAGRRAGTRSTTLHRPDPRDLDALETRAGKARARAYDVVLDGTELGGGSIRIHDPELQQRVFRLLGIGEEERARASASCSRRCRSARRRTAASPRPRPPGHADGRRDVDPRRHRLPQDRLGERPDDRGAVAVDAQQLAELGIAVAE